MQICIFCKFVLLFYIWLPGDAHYEEIILFIIASFSLAAFCSPNKIEIVYKISARTVPRYVLERFGDGKRQTQN